MIKNPFGRVLSHLRPDADPDNPDEKTPEELKRERIKFHRENVRNGPTKWRTLTTGQVRRQRVRDAKARQRKDQRRYRRAWMAQRADIATLRGHLIITGVLECQHESTTFADHQRAASLAWITQKYGPRDDDGKLVLDDKLVPTAVQNAREAFLQFTRPKVSA